MCFAYVKDGGSGDEAPERGDKNGYDCNIYTQSTLSLNGMEAKKIIESNGKGWRSEWAVPRRPNDYVCLTKVLEIWGAIQRLRYKPFKMPSGIPRLHWVGGQANEAMARQRAQ